jgi:hypothetical protein
VDERAGRMNPRTIDCGLRLETLVEDPRDDLEQRTPQPRAPGGAGREHDSVRVQCERRRHHARHPVARRELIRDQIDLAEHAVQVQVEPGNEVAGAEPEAGRERAGIALVVDDGGVRRPVLSRRFVAQGTDERECALRLLEAAELG